MRATDSFKQVDFSDKLSKELEFETKKRRQIEDNVPFPSSII